MKMYHVEAHSNFGSFAEDINAEDLRQLVQFVRETFACMNGCHDTSDVDVSWIEFEYDLVEDEDGNDITEEARESLW